MSKTNKLLTGIISATMITAAGCSNNESLPTVPEDTDCGDWEWESDEGVWECDDDDSSHYGHYYYGGQFYSTKSSLKSSSAFKSYKSSRLFKGGRTSSSSGFGKGSSGGFGG